MGLRCLLGHDFGDSEIEREREEDGDEMVVTIREVETCRRCGAERIISENKEVTSIRTAEEIGLETDEGEGSPAQAHDATSETADASDSAAGSVDSTDAEVTASTGSAGSAGSTPDSGDSGEFDDPDADDGVILPEDDPERGHGEWPETEGQPDRASPEATQSEQDSADSVQSEQDSPDATRSEQTSLDATQQRRQAQPDSEDSDRDGATQQPTDSDAAAATPSTDQPEHESGEQADERLSVADGEDDDVEILDADDDSDTTDSTAVDATDRDGIDSNTDDSGAVGGGPSDDAPDETPATGPASATGEDDQLTAEEGTAAWPDHGGADEGFDAKIASEEDVSFSGNSLTPDVEADAPGADAEYVETASDGTETRRGDTVESTRRTDVDTGIAREGSGSVDLSDVGDDVEFYCPNCGLTRGSGKSSMRPGDICPECRKGYIAER